MPAPITARAMNPTRHSKGSVPVYSAKPPHTPPSTLLVVLRRSRRCGTPAAGAGGAGCQDGWPARGGSPEDGRSEAGGSEAGGSGNGAAVMERRLSRADAREHGKRSPSNPGHRTRAVMLHARRLRKPIAHPAGRGCSEAVFKDGPESVFSRRPWRRRLSHSRAPSRQEVDRVGG